MDRKSWCPIQASRRGPPAISHFFFADDLMLFAKASVEQLGVVRQCIDAFSMASGLHISPHKSQFFVYPNTKNQLALLFSSSCGIPLTDN